MKTREIALWPVLKLGGGSDKDNRGCVAIPLVIPIYCSLTLPYKHNHCNLMYIMYEYNIQFFSVIIQNYNISLNLVLYQ